MILEDIPQSHRHRIWWIASFGIIAWLLYQIVFTTSSPMSAYGVFGDESVMIQASLRIAHGQVPHRDFYSYPPGTAYYPLAGWFALFGEQYIVVRIFSFVTAFAICVSLWWIARRLTAWGAPLPALMFALIVFPFWPFASYHWTFLLVALVSTGLLVGQPAKRRWLLAGIATGISFLILPNKALPLLAAQMIGFYFWQRQPDFTASFRRYLYGVGGVAAITALALTVLRAWQIVWQGVVMNNVLYYPPMGDGLHSLTGQLMKLMIMLMICFVLPLAFRLIKSVDRPTYYLIGLSHLAMIGSALYFFEQVHILQVFGFGLILYGWTIWLIAQHFSVDLDTKKWASYKDIKHWVSYGLSLGAICFILSVSIWEVGHLFNLSQMFSVNASKKYQYPVHTPRGTVYNNLRWNRAIAQELPIMDRLLTTGLVGQRLFILPFTPGYYYFYGYTNPTPYDILPGDTLPPGELQRLEQTLDQQVDVVAFLPHSWNGLTSKDSIMQWIAQQYPYHLSTLNGRIALYAKQPFSEQVQTLMR